MRNAVRFLLRPIAYVFHAVTSLVDVIRLEAEHDEWLLEEYEKQRKEREKP